MWFLELLIYCLVIAPCVVVTASSVIAYWFDKQERYEQRKAERMSESLKSLGEGLKKLSEEAENQLKTDEK
jgi:hypothetical protein